MYEIRKVDVRSAVKVGAISVLALALICPPIVVLVIGIFEEFVFSSSPDVLDVFEYLLDDDFWEFYVPFVPIATMGGLLIGAVLSVMYNFICARTGGLKLEILFSEELQNVQPVETEALAEKK